MERAAARAHSVSALRSHFDPLRVFPIKAPLRTKLERYDGTMDEASMTAESLSKRFVHPCRRNGNACANRATGIRAGKIEPC